MRDGDKMIAWLREAGNELEMAHAFLDGLGVPRSAHPPAECTLTARVSLLAEMETGATEARELVAAYYAYHAPRNGEEGECPCDVCERARVYFALMLKAADA